jgi:hypothetical protein
LIIFTFRLIIHMQQEPSGLFSAPGLLPAAFPALLSIPPEARCLLTRSSSGLEAMLEEGAN